MRRLFIAIFSLLYLTGCLNSNYHYSTSGKSYKPYKKESYISDISMGFISSSDFWKVHDRELFRAALKENLKELSDIRLSKYGSPFRIGVDIYDRSGKMQKKMGKFFGQKQYRLLQDYNVQAWYRIFKRGQREVLVQGMAYYTPYADTASSISYEDAQKKVREKKLRGIAKKLAIKISQYFQKELK